jgi:cullin-associated NEDD8-dissociated protein 1
MNNHLKSDKSIIACLCALKHLVTLSKGESFDLSPQIVGFIQRSAKSNDLLLKKNAISLMNTIFHTTMQPAVLELVHVVFQELVVNEDLIKTVDLGPFKHKVDEGLECRKVSYECLFSILGQFENNTRFTNKNIIDLIFERVVLGAKDPNQEIQLLAHLIIHKTFQIKKDIIVSVHTVDTLAEAFKVQIFTQLKDSAVKQELEKQSELVKSCIKLVIDLSLYLNVARIEPTKQGIASLDYSSAKYASLVELLKEISTNQKSASTLEQVLIEESHHQHHY